MSENDALRELLIEFFELSPTIPTQELTQKTIAKWDSLAMVQLITETQARFNVEFELDEIERLASYVEIHAALTRKGVRL